MNLDQFESRKADHLHLALQKENEAVGSSDLKRIHLIHEALPDLDFAEISIEDRFWSFNAGSPFFLSSMTAGHHEGISLNQTLARAAEKKKWPMGVGSQRRELTDPSAASEWKQLRKAAPKACLISNIGLSQAIQTPLKDLWRIVNSLEATALIVHTNPLQEALQPEGTPNFAGSQKVLEKICRNSPVPVILKETGCGLSESTLKRLKNTGLQAIDVSGFGGTHWGRIEGRRATSGSKSAKAAKVFADWGESTVTSLINAGKVLKNKRLAGSSKDKLEVWASGGIRSGLDAAKCIALGAQKVGFAKPALEQALLGEEALLKWMEQMEFELKVALFCTGSATPKQLRKGMKWQKI